ncbi:hypothetical protein [Variovorax sp. PBS-H4]|uniref:hypothetical protein n=1 Tax=Variovorax sp. PBS-H4 TaxID=434008 RepID=UPI0013A56D06|nr:hypothetical protein [Variovorax sp. PBS-H4]
MGEQLTVELATAIAREASPASPIEAGRFPLEVFADYRFRCERLRDASEELEQQRLAYLAETRPSDAIRVDWNRLNELQRLGEHVIFTARHRATGAIVGSLWLFVGCDLDTGIYSVTDDMLYVVPAHRDGLLGVRLVQYGERCIVALGVRSATFHFRLENGADRMARFLGYEAISTRVTKTHAGDSFADVPTRHKGSTHDSFL